VAFDSPCKPRCQATLSDADKARREFGGIFKRWDRNPQDVASMPCRKSVVKGHGNCCVHEQPGMSQILSTLL
jgi:hypothetical protein